MFLEVPKMPTDDERREVVERGKEKRFHALHAEGL